MFTTGLNGIDSRGNFVIDTIPVKVPFAPTDVSNEIFYSPGITCRGNVCQSVVTGQRVSNPITSQEVAIVATGALITAAVVNPLVGLAVATAWFAPRFATHMKTKSQTQGG